MLDFTGERIVPGAPGCEPIFAAKMYQEHIARYAFVSPLAKGADVLDVGCGVGYGARWLADQGARTIIGIDIAADAIDHARSHYLHPNVRFQVRSATDIDAASSYDLVTCFELIEHVVEQEAVLDGIARALRPNGILAISTPRPLGEIRTHFHQHELHYEEIVALLSSRFDHVVGYHERNHFTSLIAAGAVDHVERILPVYRVGIEDGTDYFVFLATNGQRDRIEDLAALMTLNDDAYVKLLERDMAILRRANDDKDKSLQVSERDLTRLQASAKQDASFVSSLLGTRGIDVADLADDDVAGRLQRLGTVLPAPVDEDQISVLRAALTEAIATIGTVQAEADARSVDAERRIEQMITSRETEARAHRDTRAALAEATVALDALRSDVVARSAETDHLLEQSRTITVDLRRQLAVRAVMLDTMREKVADLETRDAERQGELASLGCQLSQAGDAIARFGDDALDIVFRGVSADFQELAHLRASARHRSRTGGDLATARAGTFDAAAQALSATFRHHVRAGADAVFTRDRLATAKRELAYARDETFVVAAETLAATFRDFRRIHSIRVGSGRLSVSHIVDERSITGAPPPEQEDQ